MDRLDINRYTGGTPLRNCRDKKAIPHAGIPPQEESLPCQETEEKDVTFLFYMNGQYDDLEPSIAASMLSLEQVGSNKKMNLVAQLGRTHQESAHPSGGSDRIDNDWKGVRRYYITQSPLPSQEEKDPHPWLKLSMQIPDNPLISYTLGDIYTRRGETENALFHYNKAKEQGYEKVLNDPFHPDVARWSSEFDQILQPLRDQEAPKSLYASPVLESYPSMNMMNPQSLQDFIAWGMEKYPAKHYVLVMMGHGSAWSGSNRMSPSQMDMAIQSGVHQANNQRGRKDKIDVTVFNSCYMGNLESLEQMKHSSDITVASEMAARTNIFHQWGEILHQVNKHIEKEGTFKPRKFAEELVDFYRQEGDLNSLEEPMIRRSRESYLTLSAIDNKKVSDITSAWSKMIQDWDSSGIEDHKMFKHFIQSKNFHSDAYNQDAFFNFTTLRDIGDIAYNIIQDPQIPQNIKQDSQQILNALKSALISEQHTGYRMENSTGLTIWAPTNASDIALMKKEYRERVPNFANKTPWADKLEQSIANINPADLNNFLQSLDYLNRITQTLDTPGLSDMERQQLENKAIIMEEQVRQLKEKLELSRPPAQ